MSFSQRRLRRWSSPRRTDKRGRSITIIMLERKLTMPGSPTGPESVPDTCNCTFTWSATTQTWSTNDSCNSEDLKARPPNYQGTSDGVRVTTACTKPGGGGGDDEGMDVEQLGKQAADALRQLMALAESGDDDANNTLEMLMSGNLGQFLR